MLLSTGRCYIKQSESSVTTDYRSNKFEIGVSAILMCS